MSKASALEQQMLELVNAERAAIGVAPLTFDERLNDSSEDHSSWMIENNIFNHTGADGSAPKDRILDAGYELEGNYAVGENIGWQSERGEPGLSDDVADIHESLMNSPGHRAAILNPDYTEIGIGIEEGPFTTSGSTWDSVMVTQNFGTTDAADDEPTVPVATDEVAEVVDPIEEPEIVADSDTSDPELIETITDETATPEPVPPVDTSESTDVAMIGSDDFDWSSWGNSDFFDKLFTGNGNNNGNGNNGDGINGQGNGFGNNGDGVNGQNNGNGNSDWWNDLYQTAEASFALNIPGNANSEFAIWSNDEADIPALVELPELTSFFEDCIMM